MHLINLTNAVASTAVPLPVSVFKLCDERKQQHAHAVLRLKRLLGVEHIPYFTCADTFEAGECLLIPL